MPAAKVSVNIFTRRYLAEVVSRDCKNPKPIERYFNRDILPRLGHRRMDRVTGPDVQAIVFGRRDRGKVASALALRAIIKRLFDYALVCGVAKSNPAGAAPTRYVGRLKSRERVLSETEIGLLLRAFDRASHDRSAWAAELLLLTLVRKGELRLAKWPELSLDAQKWEIPPEHMKTGRAQVVHLAPRAVELFRRLRSLQHRTVECVLNMHNACQEPASASWLNQRLRIFERAARIPHFTVHDLRRTAATHLTEMGWKPEVVEKALGHALRGVRGVYNRAEFAAERKEMLDGWALYLAGLRRGE
jgi:integrase